MTGDVAIASSDWPARAQLIHGEPALLAASAAAWNAAQRDLVDAVATRLHLDPAHDGYPDLLVGAAIAATRSALLQWRTSSDSATTDPHTLISGAFDSLAAGLPDPVTASPGKQYS